MSMHPKQIPAIAAFLAAVLAAPAAMAAQTDCGVLTRTGIATQPGVLTTSSQSYLPVASYVTEEIFSAGCLHVQFSAQFRTRTPKNVRLRVTSDSGTIFPNVVNLTTSGTGYDERAVTFIVTGAADVIPVTVEVLSVDGTDVSVRNGLLRVMYGIGR